MPEIADVLKAMQEIGQKVDGAVASWDKKFEGVVNAEALAAVKAEVEAVKAALHGIPKEVMNGIGNALQPTVEKRARMEKALRLILSSPVAKNQPISVTAEMKDLGVAEGQYGGFTVPSELSTEIITKARNAQWWEPQCKRFENAPLKGSIVREGTGVTFYWNQENTAPTESNPTWGLVTWGLSDVTGLTQISNMLIKFAAFDVLGYLTDTISKDLADELLSQYMIGTGLGRPSGLRITSGVNTTTQSGAHWSEDDVINLEHTQPVKYRNGSIFIMSNNVIRYTMKLKDATGAFIYSNPRNGREKGFTGTGIPEQGLAGFIHGYPVYEHPNALDTEAWFVDLSRYYIWRSGGVEIAASSESQFGKNQTEVRSVAYEDAKLVLPEAATSITSIVE